MTEFGRSCLKKSALELVLLSAQKGAKIEGYVRHIVERGGSRTFIESFHVTNVDARGKLFRYGTKQVLKQRFGHCWDSSDLYTTLARAAGIPTRQLAGWVDGLNGHVWAESYLAEIGWLPVDATGEGIGASHRYLPYWATDDGEMLMLYTDWPRIQRIR